MSSGPQRVFFTSFLYMTQIQDRCKDGQDKRIPHSILWGAVRDQFYFAGLKLSFRLTERLKTRWSEVESLLSGQK